MARRLQAYSLASFFFQAEDGIRDLIVTGVQTCALPIYRYRIVAGLATAALAVVAACHTDTGTAPQNPALTAAQAQSLGEAMTADAQSELEGITLSGGGSFAPGMAAAALGADPASCSPTIS